MREVKVAVVREDPLTEARVLEEAKASSSLIVASGGCTALSLKALEPRLEVVAYDGNPAQIAHAEAKHRALASIDRRAFNVLDDDPSGLNQCGAFERLFRILRTAFLTWVAPASEVQAFFSSSPSEGRTLSERRLLLYCEPLERLCTLEGSGPLLSEPQAVDRSPDKELLWESTDGCKEYRLLSLQEGIALQFFLSRLRLDRRL